MFRDSLFYNDGQWCSVLGLHVANHIYILGVSRWSIQIWGSVMCFVLLQSYCYVVLNSGCSYACTLRQSNSHWFHRDTKHLWPKVQPIMCHTRPLTRGTVVYIRPCFYMLQTTDNPRAKKRTQNLGLHSIEFQHAFPENNQSHCCHYDTELPAWLRFCILLL